MLTVTGTDPKPLTLLTGASGYVGGRLLHALERRGERVRCLARRPEFMQAKLGPRTEVVRGDVLDYETLRPAMAGVQTAYYMIHSMGSEGDFEKQDRRAAENFARAAREAGVRRIIYLGGLGREPGLSRHLRSRQEVGRVLRDSGLTTIEFRASIVIGSGSLSFEMIRALVEKLPVMVTPRWVSSRAQPLAIEDLIDYLVAALDVDVEGSAIYEIGGADCVSYLEIMKEYARIRGLRRVMIQVPILTPRLSSLWLGLVTPVYARVGRELIESVRNATVADDRAALDRFGIQPRGNRAAIERALVNEDREFAETRWSDALSSGSTQSWGAKFGSRIVDNRTIEVRYSPSQAFRPIRRIGGAVGWYYADWLWRLRGFLDLLVGGVGVRRGRRDPEHLAPGETLDFWRVESYEPDRLLRLYAEMKLPGRAWLQFEVEPHEDGSRIYQTAIFDPVGVFGLVYWYALYPLHQFVFRGMLRGMVAAIEDDGRPLASTTP
ncbi:MAG: SDR family oxidoreductase [Gemmatimonadota bacterium]|nr:MAG: SDR family oxidoreductase [Gemmatimonadota bacterium]